MLKKKQVKLVRSILKKILPLLSFIFIKLKINKRVINYLSEKNFYANNIYDFSDIISQKLNKKKIITIDVGAQGGFNSDNFFPEKYNTFFDSILVEPIKEEADKLKLENKLVIEKGLWSEKKVKKIYILGNRLGSSSMYQPNQDLFSMHKIKKDDYDKYKITKTLDIECDRLDDSLTNLNVKKLDYLKIDTQGAELEILKGIGNFRPLLIRTEVQIFSLYKDVPSWNELINYLYKLNYIIIDWKTIGSHATRTPAEMDMIFIPNFKNKTGKELIAENKDKFVSLMLIFGQLNLLKLILKECDFNSFNEINSFEDLYFN